MTAISYLNRPPYKVKVEYKVTIQPKNIFADEEDEDENISKKNTRRKSMLEGIDGNRSQGQDDSQSISATIKSKKGECAGTSSLLKKECARGRKKKRGANKLHKYSNSQNSSLLSKSCGAPLSRTSKKRSSLNFQKCNHPSAGKKSNSSLNSSGSEKDERGPQISIDFFLNIIFSFLILYFIFFILIYLQKNKINYLYL